MKRDEDKRKQALRHAAALRELQKAAPRFFNSGPPEIKLRSPLVSAIELRPSPIASLFVVRQGEDASNSPWVAELSTYELSLDLKYHPDKDSERKGLLGTLERVMEAAEAHEPFPRCVGARDYNAQLNKSHPVTVDWDKTPPKAKINGDFTFDMLCHLYEMGLLETNPQIAQAFKKAAMSEKRGPMQTTAGETYGLYDSQDFSRENIGDEDVDGLGDLSRVDPVHRYGQLIRDLRDAVARGMIGKEGIESMVMSAAALTLDGHLLSPHGTARFLLSNGGRFRGKSEEAVRALMPKLFEDRVRKIMQDVVGPGQHFVVTEQEGVIDVGEVGKSQPVTFGGLKHRLRVKWDENVKAGAPLWFRGSPQEWRKLLQRDVRREIDDYPGEKISLSEEPSRPAGMGDGDEEIAKIDQAVQEQQAREREAQEEKALVPYRAIIPASSNADFTYFGGVTRDVTSFWDDGGSEPDAIPRAFYTTRNPDLNEPPRPIPAALQHVLDQEGRPPGSKLLRDGGTRKR